MEKNKKTYITPECFVVPIEPPTLLAGSPKTVTIKVNKKNGAYMGDPQSNSGNTSDNINSSFEDDYGNLFGSNQIPGATAVGE